MHSPTLPLGQKCAPVPEGRRRDREEGRGEVLGLSAEVALAFLHTGCCIRQFLSWARCIPHKPVPLNWLICLWWALRYGQQQRLEILLKQPITTCFARRGSAGLCQVIIPFTILCGKSSAWGQFAHHTPAVLGFYWSFQLRLSSFLSQIPPFTTKDSFEWKQFF